MEKSFELTNLKQYDLLQKQVDERVHEMYTTINKTINALSVKMMNFEKVQEKQNTDIVEQKLRSIQNGGQHERHLSSDSVVHNFEALELQLSDLKAEVRQVKD